MVLVEGGSAQRPSLTPRSETRTVRRGLAWRRGWAAQAWARGSVSLAALAGLRQCHRWCLLGFAVPE